MIFEDTIRDQVYSRGMPAGWNGSRRVDNIVGDSSNLRLVAMYSTLKRN